MKYDQRKWRRVGGTDDAPTLVARNTPFGNEAQLIEQHRRANPTGIFPVDLVLAHPLPFLGLGFAVFAAWRAFK